ncbi:hypothetical protein GOB86_03075 [Acetobacter lambici]|uniref:Uncharacterized protein n=1 Tax=Acetobacter lambici TaxID=1332824 RepID=A0ABT1F1P3_9PROT|nr:hypothetical protein [Acetobacter lambici]MCP1242142.1 hypothetical protein [Acetobacter lambici]MCP1258174.1 hypothetical protein [Acetobacter lambici]NHO56065.1 hypothetical protein [Acetobacter lambici]
MPHSPTPQNQTAGADGVVWKDFPQAAILNLVTAEIVRNFPRPLQDDNRRVHAPTLFAALGSVCGFATQTSLLALIQSGLRPEQDMMAHTLAGGRTFLFGEQLNQLLMQGDTALHNPGLWPCLSSPALQKGYSPQDFPDLNAQFACVASRLGTAEEGIPDVATAYRPLIATEDLREAMWVYMEPIFLQNYPDKPGPHGPLPKEFWGAAMNVAAGMLFSTMFNVMDARIAMTIILQSAIFGSKIIET